MGAAPPGLGLPAPPPEALIPSDLPGAAAGLEQENDDIGLELVNLISALQEQQLSEQGDMLAQLLESLGIGGAEQNPLDGAAMGSAVEMPGVPNAGTAMPPPGMQPEASLTPREAGIGDMGMGGAEGLAGALGV